MLDKPLKIPQRESMEFDVIPEGIYQVELLDVASEERPTYATRNLPTAEQELEVILNFTFGLLEGKDGETSLVGRKAWANFVPTAFYISKKNGKNKLYRIVEALIGKTVELAEYTEFEKDASTYLNNLIGKQCKAVIQHKVVGDKTYANMENFVKSDVTMEAPVKEEKKEEIKVDDIPF